MATSYNIWIAQNDVGAIGRNHCIVRQILILIREKFDANTKTGVRQPAVATKFSVNVKEKITERFIVSQSLIDK